MSITDVLKPPLVFCSCISPRQLWHQVSRVSNSGYSSLVLDRTSPILVNRSQIDPHPLADFILANDQRARMAWVETEKLLTMDSLLTGEDLF